MNLTSVLDYIIAITGLIIIIGSFAWNIYEVFLKGSHTSSDKSQFSDSDIR